MMAPLRNRLAVVPQSSGVKPAQARFKTIHKGFKFTLTLGRYSQVQGTFVGSSRWRGQDGGCL